MSNDVFKKYEKIKTIGNTNYSIVYKAKNIQTGYYYAIKEINKKNCKIDIFHKTIEIMKKLQSENCVNIKEIFDTKENYYIIMDYCKYNLEKYMNRRENLISSNEIREILIELNNTFKNIIKQNININLKPNNLLISLDRLDKCLIKISDYGINNFSNPSLSKSIIIEPNSLILAPEVIKDEKQLISQKSEIWSLGVIIYYMLFKEYPYQGKGDYQLLKDINSNKKLKSTNNKELNDLLNKMLEKNVDNRITWDNYFNHSFFKKEIKTFEYPQFNFKCKFHSKDISSYCKTCMNNICENCLKEHFSHQLFPFSKIGLSDEEFNKFNNLIQQNENYLNNMFISLSNINNLMYTLKSIKRNYSIYENDNKNNYKNYYMNILEIMNEQLTNNLNLNIMDINVIHNYIISQYDIKSDKLKIPIRILNCYEESKKEISWFEGINNEKEIKDNCEIYLNNIKQNFNYKLQFTKEGIYQIEIVFKNPLIYANYIFCNCIFLTTLDLSNFNSNNVKDMSRMFYKCTSLESLNLTNIKTNNVTNMSHMFYDCPSLKSLNLSSFDTRKVQNMREMFYNCSSLVSLDLTSFNTIEVKDMSHMFSGCTLLQSLDLSNFNTNKINDMRSMFKGVNKNCIILSNDILINNLINENFY